jgi:hypothetical protein
MPTLDELQKAHEAALEDLTGRRSGQGTDSDWALVRALIHRAVHLAAERKSAEYCAVATYLAEMIGHAHGLMHASAEGHGRDASHSSPVH